MPKKYRLTKINKAVNHQPIFDESEFEIDYLNELSNAGHIGW